jgi:hypothetical protein
LPFNNSLAGKVIRTISGNGKPTVANVVIFIKKSGSCLKPIKGHSKKKNFSYIRSFQITIL